jgi:nitroreductase
MPKLVGYIARIKPAQWILIAAGVLAGAAALLMGVNDNPPGIALAYLGLGCLAGAWVWNWRAPRDFWILLVITLAAFPVSAILHNLFYALGILIFGPKYLSDILGFLEVFFFLVAVMVVAPAALVALVGGIITSWKGVSGLTRVNRSIRRFKQHKGLKEKQLRKLVNNARLSASGANHQPLKFILSNTEERNKLIFPTLSWAGYLQDWPGPEEGQRPAGYIIVLGDRDLAKSFQYDAGIACQSITLGAVEMGLGACLIGSIKRDTLQRALNIPESYEILLVIALGVAEEEVVLEELGPEGDIKYWRDERGRHHVPKRSLDELILEL